VEAVALQPAFAEVEGGDAAGGGGGAGDALPAAAVRAGPPRREGARGVGCGGDGTPEPEQRRGLVRPARSGCWWLGSLVVAGGEGAGELVDSKDNEQAQQELLVAGTGDHIESSRLVPLVAHASRGGTRNYRASVSSL
jgi:hypothetical protein